MQLDKILLEHIDLVVSQETILLMSNVNIIRV